jgi:uncharacterized membrane protein
MRRSIHSVRLVAAVATVLALMAVVAPVTARSPHAVTIVSHVTFNPDGPNYGDFVASGAAVDAGLICDAGTFVDTGIRFAGFQSDRGMVQLQVAKSFTCDDGSGSFPVRMQIQADFETGIESFSWVAKAGDGDYAAFNGAGKGSTVPEPPTGNINTYEGFLID